MQVNAPWENRALREQVEDPARIRHEALVAQLLRIGGRRLFVAENQYRQTLMLGIERLHNRGARTWERQAANIQLCVERRVAGQQAFDRRAIRADKALTGMFRIGEARFQQ